MLAKQQCPVCHSSHRHSCKAVTTSTYPKQFVIVLLLLLDGLPQPCQLSLALFDCLGAQPAAHIRQISQNLTAVAN